MNEIKKAIILAAGQSKRMGTITDNLPKCLLSLGDKTILEHQIENLLQNGIKEIIIVTGFCEQKIKEFLKNERHIRIRYITNPIFYKTNSLYSLWLAKDEVKEGFVVLNSDVVFHPFILRNLLSSPFKDALTISYHKSMGEEEMKIKIKDSKVIDISKDIPPQDADGENVGIVKFSPSGAKVLFQEIKRLVDKGITNEWAPFAFKMICTYYPLYAVSTDNLPWIEIDFIEDLQKAREDIYPKIKKTL